MHNNKTMKKYTLLFTLLIFVSLTSQSQDKMTEKDVLGSWKMVIEMEEVMEELDEEADETESMLAKILIESVSGIVEGVMDNIEIRIDFERGGDAQVMVDAFDESAEDEETEWYIKSNRLYIDETDRFQSDSDGYWVLRDDVLFFENYDGDDDVAVYMVRVEY